MQCAGVIAASSCQPLLKVPIEVSVPCLLGQTGALRMEITQVSRHLLYTSLTSDAQVLLRDAELVCRVQLPEAVPQFVQAQLASALECSCLVRAAWPDEADSPPAVVPLKLDKSSTSSLTFIVTAAVDSLKSSGAGSYCFVCGTAAASQLPSNSAAQQAIKSAPAVVQVSDDSSITGPEGEMPEPCEPAAPQLVSVGSPVSSATLLARDSQLQLVFIWDQQTMAQPLLARPSDPELVTLMLDTATVKAMLEGFKLVKRVAHRKALLPLFAELAQQVLGSCTGQWHKLVVSLRNVCAAVQQLCVSQELVESASRPLLELFREKVLRMQHFMFGEGYSQAHNLEFQRLLSFAMWPHKYSLPDPFSLASAGLYYGGSAEMLDSVVHFESGTAVSHWQEGDNPFGRLLKANPASLVAQEPLLNVPLSATLACSFPLQHSPDEQPVSHVSAMIAAPLMATASQNGRVVLWESSLGLRPLNAFNVLNPSLPEPGTSQQYHCLLEQGKLNQAGNTAASVGPHDQQWATETAGALSVRFRASLTPEMDGSLVMQLRAVPHTESGTWYEIRWSEDSITVLKCSTPSSELHTTNNQESVTAMLEQTLVATKQLGSGCTELWQHGAPAHLWVDVKQGSITSGQVAEDGTLGDPLIEYSDVEETALLQLSSLNFSSPTESLCTVSAVAVTSEQADDESSG